MVHVDEDGADRGGLLALGRGVGAEEGEDDLNESEAHHGHTELSVPARLEKKNESKGR